MYKKFKQDNKGNWYAVIGDDNLVLTSSKDMEFEFSVTKWYACGDLFVGRIKKL